MGIHWPGAQASGWQGDHLVSDLSGWRRDGYIVTYLLPFLAVNFREIRDVISLALVFFVIGLLYVNSNMIYTNPVLNIAGYHIFEVEHSEGKTTALICKRAYMRAGSELTVISLGDYVLMEQH